MQISFSDAEFSSKKKVTRRERLLNDLDRLIPWTALKEALEPHYPKNKGPGRPTRGLETMLRMYVVQLVLGLSDEGTEDAVYDSQSVRRFVGIDLGRQDAPDHTTLTKFRHRLEQHDLTRVIFETINGQLSANGLFLKEGTIVDATLIAAPPSTKNRDKARDPEMHQSKKGNQWHFGLKAHIGADLGSGLVHTMVATAGNVSDITQAHALLHGEERAALGDAGYQGIEKRPEMADCRAQWHVAMRPGKRKELKEDDPLDQRIEQYEKCKASLRAKVEHPFHVIKNLFKHRKARYRGLAKNQAHLFSLFGLANLVLAKRYLEPVHSQGAS